MHKLFRILTSLGLLALAGCGMPRIASEAPPPNAEQVVLQYTDGGRYQGALRDGRRHGRGVYIYPNGDRYSGAWQNGRKQGWGVYQWASGNRYEGFWSKGREHGSGRLIFSDGAVCEGQWRAGVSQQPSPQPLPPAPLQP